VWRHVLVHKYGKWRGKIDSGGRKASTWLKDIASIQKGSFNGINNWSENYLFRQLGNGEDSIFWDDLWVGEGIIFRECFPCLAGIYLESGINDGGNVLYGVGSWRRGMNLEKTVVCMGIGSVGCFLCYICLMILFCIIIFLTNGYGELLTPSPFLSTKLNLDK
jgi:hypothetical protein